jgi:formylmethanofuran dehydrogenase subunit C
MVKKLLDLNPDILSLKDAAVENIRKEEYRKRISPDYNKLHEIAKDYVRKASEIPHWRMKYLEKIFNMGERIAVEYSVTLSEVEEFFNNILFNYVKGGLFGAFISGMCSTIMKKDDRIHFQLENYLSVSGIGFRHSRGVIQVNGNRAYYLGAEAEGGEISVKGDVGNYLGKLNDGCKILVEGNARNWVGKMMKNGSIVITGNAGDILGEKMSGGEIVVEGNAGYWVGDDMTGGIIRIKGDFSVSNEVRGGEIYCWSDGWVSIR